MSDMNGVDDLASAAVRSIQLARELLELLLKTGQIAAAITKGTAQIGVGVVGLGVAAGKAIYDHASPTGRVLAESRRTGQPIIEQKAMPIDAMDKLKQMCAERNIPVAFKTAKNSKFVTAMFAGGDKDIFKDTLTELTTDRLKAKPQDFAFFNVKPGAVSGLKGLCEQNGIEVNFVQTSSDKVAVVYKIKDQATLDIIKNDFKKAAENVSKEFAFEHKPNGKFSFRQGNSLSKDAPEFTTKRLPTRAKLEQILQDRFGYDSVSSKLAADKFAKSLSDEQRRYFGQDTRQVELIKNLDRDIKLPGDPITLRDYSFTRLRFSDDDVDRFNVMNDGDKAVTLAPSQMTRMQMEDLVKQHFGVTDPEVVKHICDKTEALSKMMSEQKQRGFVEVDKISKDKATAVVDGKKLTFSLAPSDKLNSIRRISKAFGIPLKDAQAVFKAAEKQSVLANKIKLAVEKVKNAATPIKDKKAKKGAI
ncbi:MAG: hypothetical protein LBU36_07980 [Clostridiales bacterium]|nr:hypothetical protein [Clostridiales bacterium]